MNTLGQVKPPGNSKKSQSAATNPFARALAEQEKASTNTKKQPGANEENLFSEALAKAGGQFPDNLDFNPEDLLRQQEEMEELRKKAEMRKKLHDQVNPADQTEIFNQEKIRTQKELEEVRKELKVLAKEISMFYKEVDIQTTQTVTQQGVSGGVGLKTYFQKLKEFIRLLTQKVKSARTWMQQQNSKKARSRKIRGGVMLDGGGAQESKAVFDMMHHERSNAYSGA